MRLHWVVLVLAGCGAGDPAVLHQALAPGGPVPPQAMGPPSVRSIVPGAAHAGDTVTFVGSGFTGATGVTFPGAAAVAATVADDAHLTAVVPAGAVNGGPTVTGPLGSSAPRPFVVLESAAPTLSMIAPTSGGVGTVVQITGTNLGGVFEARFDGILTNVTNASATQVSAVAPQGMTSGMISVTNSAGSATAAMSFGIQPSPRIYSLTPPAGKPGDTITASGKRFTGVANVSVGGTPATTFTVVNDTTLTFVVPAGVTSGQIMIGQTIDNTFRLTAGAAPTISMISPATLGQVPLTVTGTNLAGLREARIGALPLTFNVMSATQVQIYGSPAARTGTLTLVNDAGSATSAITVVQAPLVRRLMPSAAHIGDTLTIEGTRLSGATQVAFDGTPAPTATPTVVDDAHLTVVVPAGATNGSVRIITPDNAVYAPQQLHVISTAAPTITNVSPASFAPGSPVTLTGTGFAGLTSIAFGGVVQSAQPSSDTRLSASVPFGALAGPITVSNDAGTASAAATLLAPTRISPLHLTPLSGKPGDQVTITGAGFNDLASVQLGGVSADFQIVDDATLKVWVPYGTGTPQPIFLTGNSGQSNSTLQPFTVEPGVPVIVDFQPSTVVAGSDVSLTGQGFGGATSIKLNGIETRFFPYGGDTNIAFRVPDGATGGTITVTNASGTGSSVDTLAVVPAPSVSGVSPASAKAGDTVTLTGNDLAQVFGVGMSGSPARIPASASATQLSFVLPPTTSSAPVLVTPFGSTSGKLKITVQATAAPIIEALSPLSDAAPGPNAFAYLNGENLWDVTDVTFNGASALRLYNESDQQLIVQIPDDATTGGVTAITLAGNADSPLPMTFATRPVIANLTPSSGPPGTSVVLTGSNLSKVYVVIFGDVSTTPLVVSDAELHAVVPPGARTAPVHVYAGSGAQADGPPFTAGGTLAPVLGDFLPLAGGNGDYVQLRGLNLDGITSVSFNGVAATINSADADTLRVIVPPGVTSGPITVTNDAGSATTAVPFTAAPPRAPQVSGVSPAAVVTGGMITVAGTQLEDAGIRVGKRDDANQLDTTSTNIVVQLSRFDVGPTVTAINQYGETSVPLYVGTPPTIASFTPSSGMAGDSVIVTGTGFTGATVAFNGTPAIAVISSDVQLSATVPSGATTGAITVTNPLGTATSATPFTITGGPNPGGGCGCDVGAAPLLPAPALLITAAVICFLRRRRERR